MYVTVRGLDHLVGHNDVVANLWSCLFPHRVYVDVVNVVAYLWFCLGPRRVYVDVVDVVAYLWFCLGPRRVYVGIVDVVVEGLDGGGRGLELLHARTLALNKS